MLAGSGKLRLVPKPNLRVSHLWLEVRKTVRDNSTKLLPSRSVSPDLRPLACVGYARRQCNKTLEMYSRIQITGHVACPDLESPT